MEQLDPPIDGHSSSAPLKSTNSPELVQEPLSGEPNEGPPPDLSMLYVPQPMAVNGWPKKAREDRGLLRKPPEGRGASGDQVAPSQNSNTLNHLTHSRL
jgi:hypothetical protein